MSYSSFEYSRCLTGGAVRRNTWDMGVNEIDVNVRKNSKAKLAPPSPQCAATNLVRRRAPRRSVDD
eukprot:3723575-Prymnesium_polylepis.1